MAKLKANARKKMNEIDLHDSLLNIKAALADATGDMKERASEMVSDLLENIQSKSSDYQSELEERVRDKPLKSIGLAVLFGVLIGKFVV